MKRSRAALALVAGLALAVAGCGSNDDTGTTGEATTTVDTAALPADLAYRTVGGLRVPSSRVDGPATTAPPQGYSHTPQGAALAAANGQAALATAPDAQWAETVRTVTAPGPGRDEFAYARTLMTVQGSVAEEDAATFVGFRVTEYEPSRAIVLLATRTPTRNGASLTTAYPVETAWLAGDWKIVLPQQKDEIDAVEISDLDGFTNWEEKA